MSAVKKDWLFSISVLVFKPYHAIHFQHYLVPDQSCNLSAASRYKDECVVTSPTVKC